MMLSHVCAGGDFGRSEHSQASPIDTPSIWLRDAGQMEDSPSMRTVHRVVIGTIGTEEARVDG